MARTTKFKDSTLTLRGKEVKVGDKAPGFTLTGNDMADVRTDRYHGKVLLIASVPSLDTPVCAIETKRWNKEITQLSKDVRILVVSEDLPFAQKRWCGAEGVTAVETASDYKYRRFAEDYGVYIEEWGLLTRAIFIADKNGIIRHVEYVSDVSVEPDYASALAVTRKLL
jgi:thioredoxin-dependent peroxiredoxin